MPRYIDKSVADAAGQVDEAELPYALPYNLRPVDALRMVEDVHSMLHEVNCKLHDMGYDRMEELLDPAGFSGLVSRSVVDRLGRSSKSLTPNRYHNGYPDLLPRGVYPGDSVQHGTRGGLEVKASRFESSWQSHGPRAGWFCVVQFDLDRREAVAQQDREPTRLQAVLIAELELADWSWAPAAAGKIRSGTASIKASGEVKLRKGAVWIDPTYEDAHKKRLATARLGQFGLGADGAVLASLAGFGRPASAQEIAEQLAPTAGLDPPQILSRVNSSLRRLILGRQVVKPSKGLFQVS